jgi:hypothetical protein
MGAEMDADGCAVATGPAANHGRESPPAGAQAATDVRRESKIVLVMHDAERFSIICHIGQVADVLGLSMYNFAGLQFHANEI